MLLIAIPVFRVTCKVSIDKARPWAIVDELILWSVSRQAKSIETLALESNLPFRVVVASVNRLMRFRLIEITLSADAASIHPSDYGSKIVSSGDTLPYIAKTHSRRVSFIVERASGGFLLARDVKFMSRHKLELESQNGAEVRQVVVDGPGPSMSHEANFDRLVEIVARGWGEQIANIDGRTATTRDGFMIGRVVDGVCRDIPSSASPQLRKVFADSASLKPGDKPIQSYISPSSGGRAGATTGIPCNFALTDIVIGGQQQRACLLSLLSNAHRRVIIHSTFLDPARFGHLFDQIRSACVRGVRIDILWGAGKDDESENRSAIGAVEIMKMVRADPDTNRMVQVHMTCTQSHAKFVLADTAEDLWIAAIGSCNWLSTPFQSVEISVVLRDAAVVAQVARTVQGLLGRRGLAADLATEMAIISRDLLLRPAVLGDAYITIVTGEEHEKLMRRASGSAKHSLVIGSNRLGSTARPGAIMPSEHAAARPGVRATIIYTRPSGPLKNKDARLLTTEAAENGVNLIHTDATQLHGKFLAWDDNDLVVTSLNWASASGDDEFPWGEIGVHITAPNVAASTLSRLQTFFPKLR
ncbi:phospholipase D-like domain-containing protein [Massilia scottii]|uniref:phospholipase D-like domain-containing protein n=1 Tax=Massilia scottii TaxID=3057166 RepID=UPI002796838C|nr:phospholipase D-like domain-containing protein [Massilia sp. CCM 9029]MDQ1835479.1 phospholipase D-like domain-containing protein [Massilia sp. CCM 9029]